MWPLCLVSSLHHDRRVVVLLEILILFFLYLHSSREPETLRHACAYRDGRCRRVVKPPWIHDGANYRPSYNVSPRTNTYATELHVAHMHDLRTRV